VSCPQASWSGARRKRLDQVPLRADPVSWRHDHWLIISGHSTPAELG